MSSKEPEERSIAARWGGSDKLAEQFCPVSSFFLAHYPELKSRPVKGSPGGMPAGLSSAEAMLVIQLLDFKWGEDAPFPKVDTIGKRMGITGRSVRTLLARLIGLGFLRREIRVHKSSRYHLDGLFEALEELYDALAEKDDGTPKGTQLPDGSLFVGKMKDGKPHGRGKATYPDSSTYTGEWKNGFRHGRGVWTWPDSSSYAGQWANGFQNGRGTATAADGTTRIGEWKAGQWVEPTTANTGTEAA
jgi:hypothetical protein